MSFDKIYCESCDEPIPSIQDAWQKVEGYERPRRGGGTNHVALRETFNVFVCNRCMTLLRAGLDAKQETLI
jgi:hypothetical protein